MKKTLCGLLAFLVIAAAGVAYAQVDRDAIKERKALAKSSKSELNRKASKAAQKEAKKLKKEGWKIAPGALPLEKQLDQSYMMQYQYDNDGFPKYIMAEAISIGGNYDAAKMQALELAKQNLASQIQTEIVALVENTVANQQLDHSDAASITRSIMAGKSHIVQLIGRVIPVVETYRVLDGNRREVLVRVAYSSDQAKSVARRTIGKHLEERGDSLHQDLNKYLNI